MSTKITADEAASRLGISARRVRQLIRDGTLPATYIGEGRRKTWLIDPGDLGKAEARDKKRGPKTREAV